MTIVEFLSARIAEDEATDPACGRLENVEHHEVDCLELTAIVRSDAKCDCEGPRRWLAECQAKRAIVDMHKPTTLEDLWGAARADLAKRLVCDYDSSPDSHLGDTAEWPCTTLRHLAAVYADHPDYQEEWRPT